MNYRALLSALFALTLSIHGISPEGATIVAWRFEHDDLSYLQKVVDIAHQNGVNQIQLSGEIVNSVSAVVHDPERARRIRQVTLSAQQKEMAVYLSIREFQDISDGEKISLDDPGFWGKAHERYKALHEVLPEIDGLVLSVDSVELSIFDSARIQSAMNGAARLSKLVTELDTVCRELDWDLWVQFPEVPPTEVDRIIQAISSASKSVGVIIPALPYRSHPDAPDHPAIGRFADRRQIVEMDLGNTHYGRCLIPYCCPERVSRQISYALSKGAAGAVARVDCGHEHCVGTPNEVNLFTFCRLLADPSTTIDRIWTDYLQMTFGEKEHKNLRFCLESTGVIIEKTFLTQRLPFLNDESRIPDLKAASKDLESGALSAWIPNLKKNEVLLKTITPSVAQSMVVEKDEAVAKCLEAHAALERARASAQIPVYIGLSAQLEMLEDAARLWRDLTDAYCAYQLWKQDSSENRRARLALSHQQLSSWLRYLRSAYGEGHPIFDADRLDNFLQQIAPPPPEPNPPVNPGPGGQPSSSPPR